jgi:hypothetical protein
MSQKFKRTLDTSQADCRFVEEFERQVAMLAGMVHEAIEVTPTYLRSPIMRKLLSDKAREVAGLLRPLRGRLAADNPGEDLKPIPGDP